MQLCHFLVLFCFSVAMQVNLGRYFALVYTVSAWLAPVQSDSFIGSQQTIKTRASAISLQPFPTQLPRLLFSERFAWSPSSSKFFMMWRILAFSSWSTKYFLLEVEHVLLADVCKILSSRFAFRICLPGFWNIFIAMVLSSYFGIAHEEFIRTALRLELQVVVSRFVCTRHLQLSWRCL